MGTTLSRLWSDDPIVLEMVEAVWCGLAHLRGLDAAGGPRVVEVNASRIALDRLQAAIVNDVNFRQALDSPPTLFGVPLAVRESLVDGAVAFVVVP